MIIKAIVMLLMPFLLWGTTYDATLLQIGAKLFPKVLFMEKGTNERIQSSINLVIVAAPSNKEAAQRLSEMIERQYGGTLSNHLLNLSIVSPKEAMEIKNAHGLILLMEPDEAILPLLLDHASKNKILTFCFDPSLLQKGAAVSLYIGRSVKPYINLTALKQVPFTFEYGFLKLSQPY
jgi:hypothetical protein